jgi:hypothetical protein
MPRRLGADGFLGGDALEGGQVRIEDDALTVQDDHGVSDLYHGLTAFGCVECPSKS